MEQTTTQVESGRFFSSANSLSPLREHIRSARNESLAIPTDVISMGIPALDELILKHGYRSGVLQAFKESIEHQRKSLLAEIAISIESDAALRGEKIALTRQLDLARIHPEYLELLDLQRQTIEAAGIEDAIVEFLRSCRARISDIVSAPSI